MTIKRIGLYARVSSKRQTDERTIESQIAALKERALNSGESIDPDLIFLDDGVSGASLERQGLDKMRDCALRGGLEKVYILSPDRLSRKNALQILLLDEFNRLGVTFSFHNRDIGDTPEDQMLLQIQGVIAEYEREKIMERSRRGKLHAAKSGRVSVLGGAPYGYFYQKVTESSEASYVVISEEAKIVKEAFQLYALKQASIGEIARIFTEKAYKTKTGITFWERSVIWGMLRNPAYKGMAAFRKTTRVKRQRRTKLAIESTNPLRSELSSSRDRPQSDWIGIAVPSIVSEKLFDLAQERLEKNKKLSPRNNKRFNYLLSGLLRCATCGYSIYGKPASNSKYKRLYYRCMGQDGHRWPNGRVCKGHPVRTEAIDDLVWDSIKSLVMAPKQTLSEYNQRLSKVSSIGDFTSFKAKKRQQIRKLQQEKDRLIDLYQDGLIEKNNLTPRLKTNNAKANKIEQEIRLLEKQEAEKESTLTIIKSLSDFVNTIHKNLDSCSFGEKRYLVRLLVEEVLVDSIKEEINVKHVIPTNDPKKKCPLRSGSTN